MFKDRPHASIKKIYEKSLEGDAFFVNRAAANGDLSPLPENIQRQIVAVANQKAADFANEQIIPLTEESYKNNNYFIERHSDFASRIFFDEGDQTIEEQIKKFYK